MEDVCGSSTPAIAGSFQPNNPLAAFNGVPLAGTWELKAFDHNIGDTGSVIEWCLLPELSPPTFSLSPTRLDISIEPGKSQTGTITITNTGDSTLFWYITTTSGQCDQPNGLEWASVVPNNGALLPGEGTIT